MKATVRNGIIVPTLTRAESGRKEQEHNRKLREAQVKIIMQTLFYLLEHPETGVMASKEYSKAYDSLQDLLIRGWA
jgi:hypothetical protein